VKTGRTILKNFASLVTADILVKAVGFVVTLYLARRFSANEFGAFSFAISIVNYFSFVTDPGLTTYGATRTAREPLRVSDYINTVLSVRLVLTAAAFIAVAAVAALIPQPAVIKALILCYGVMLFPQAVNPSWIYQGLQKMELVGAYNVAHSLFYAGLIFGLTAFWPDVRLVPVSLTLAYFLASAIFLVPVFTGYYDGFRMTGLREAFAAAKESLPIGVSTFLVAGVNWNLSTTLLGFLASQEQTGYFSIAMKLGLVIMGGGIAFGMTLLPVFSKHMESSRDTAEKVLSLSEKAILLAGLPVIFGVLATADPVMSSVFGVKYLPAGSTLKLLIPGAVLYALNLVHYVYMIAEGRQVANMWISAARTAALAALSVPLVLAKGADGAAAAYTAAELMAFCVYLGKVKTPVGPLARMAAALPKPLAASLIMFAAVYAIPQSHALLKIPAGVLVYAAAIFAVGGVRAGEIRKLASYAKGGRPPEEK